MDGEWGDWTGWSRCSRSCGSGTQKRQRTCLLPPQHGGQDCLGDSDDTRPCKTQSCLGMYCIHSVTELSRLLEKKSGNPNKSGNSTTVTWKSQRETENVREKVGTGESFFFVRIESRIESAVRFVFESNLRIESAVYTTQAVTRPDGPQAYRTGL